MYSPIILRVLIRIKILGILVRKARVLPDQMMNIYQLDGSLFVAVFDKDERVCHGFCRIFPKTKFKY